MRTIDVRMIEMVGSEMIITNSAATKGALNVSQNRLKEQRKLARSIFCRLIKTIDQKKILKLRQP